MVEDRKQRGQPWRALLVGVVGSATGLLIATAAPGISGCIIPDSCTITGLEPGHDWCLDMVLGWEWRDGDDPVTEGQAINGVHGCDCFDNVAVDILNSGTPQCDYNHHYSSLVALARAACQEASRPGWVNNCDWTTEEINDVKPPEFQNLHQVGIGSCPGACGEWSGNCANELKQSCPEAPAATSGGPGCGGTTGDGGGGGDGLDSSSGAGGGGLDAWLYVSCNGNDCDVDSDFVDGLYDNPGLLLTEDPRLQYNGSEGMYEFIDVSERSLAWELGLRTGDLLYEVESMVIDDEESGLDAAAALWGATSIEVVVKRGSQWLTFDYTAV